jgi:hypothetical protein
MLGNGREALAFISFRFRSELIYVRRFGRMHGVDSVAMINWNPPHKLIVVSGCSEMGPHTTNFSSICAYAAD